MGTETVASEVASDKESVLSPCIVGLLPAKSSGDPVLDPAGSKLSLFPVESLIDVPLKLTLLLDNIMISVHGATDTLVTDVKLSLKDGVTDTEATPKV